MSTVAQLASSPFKKKPVNLLCLDWAGDLKFLMQLREASKKLNLECRRMVDAHCDDCNLKNPFNCEIFKYTCK